MHLARVAGHVSVVQSTAFRLPYVSWPVITCVTRGRPMAGPAARPINHSRPESRHRPRRRPARIWKAEPLISNTTGRRQLYSLDSNRVQGALIYRHLMSKRNKIQIKLELFK